MAGIQGAVRRGVNGGARGGWWAGRASVLVTALLAVSAFALAVVVRLRLIDAPLSFDEFASIFFADRPYSELWGWWMERETNPALFYTAVKLWRMVLPGSIPVLRMLPLIISLAQIALLARFAQRTYGGFAAVLAILLLALSPSDVFLSIDVRAYGLAKLAVTVSFIGLMTALGDDQTKRLGGWLVYAGGSVAAIYTHSTMLLWPLTATLAVLVDAAIARNVSRGALVRLFIANIAIAVLAVWELMLVAVQLDQHTSNIAWIQSLAFEDFRDQLVLQLFMENAASTALMLALIVVGLARTFRNRATRLSLLIAVFGMAAFKAADHVHPIVSDYTLHWCATFTVLIAAAALASGPILTLRPPTWVRAIAGAAVLAIVARAGFLDLRESEWMPHPQDWGYTVRTVARTPGAALLASHESIGLVIEEACRLEFRRPGCPFPLVVMTSPSQADSWSRGGYSGHLVAPGAVRAALSPAHTVFAFSRYVYDPLAPLGLDPERYKAVEWDDGKLIGPIPIGDFRRPT